MLHRIRQNIVSISEEILAVLYLVLMLTVTYLVRDSSFMYLRHVVADLKVLGLLSSLVFLGLLLLQVVRLRRIHRGSVGFNSPLLRVQLFVQLIAFGQALVWTLLAIAKWDVSFTWPNFVLVPFALVNGVLVVKARRQLKKERAANSSAVEEPAPEAAKR
jgi:hypothetical protein